MEELLKNKLKAVKELKVFTENIKEMSLTSHYQLVNTMLEERQRLMDDINLINEKINLGENPHQSKQGKSLNKEIKELFVEISELDNLIRRNINDNLKNIRDKLQLKDTGRVNIRI